MTLNGVRDTIKQELRKKSLHFEEKESNSTNSIYYTVYFTHTKMLFRISDHFTSKDVSTFIYSDKTTVSQLARYVENRIKDAKTRELTAALSMVQK